MEYFQASNWKIYSTWMFLISFDVVLQGSDGSLSKAEIENHLELGRDLLAKGRLQDALSHYHAAVEGDPNNYLTYFKRGTIYLALGKARLAISDLNRVLELKPDFTAARLQRANTLLKQGQLNEAKQEFENVLKLQDNEEAHNGFRMADQLQNDYDNAQFLMKGGSFGDAIEVLNPIIESCPWSSQLRELRSHCHLSSGNTMAAIWDLKSTTKLQPDNTAGYYKLSMLHYQLGEYQDSLREVRECLKLDPEHSDCFPHYKKVKKIEKFLTDCQTALENKEYSDCVDSANKVLKNEPDVAMIRYAALVQLCQCHLHNNEAGKSVKACGEALAINKEPAVLCDRAEAYIKNDMYDEAIKDYHDALDINDSFKRAKEGIVRAQKLRKQTEKRDYYKILGVKKTATKKEIVKAYRKAAQTWHPDNFQEGDEKKKAEKMFIDIAAAKEVLTDEEKRKKFDMGDDPLDPESPEMHGDFNPFQQFHQFHGSPFQFKFQFN
ncbi:dnaJ homolog subfamily C member 3 [Nilaparvata lugens]|uniref:dnaJ homolog subfamily C member 3 n=1 Tax=Nilaparvata lugens TaxID=108931 RepID=UPI000B98054F|nr:dnaJ homolog subfamily C member 3 [Nilaparvata lugens]